MGSQRERVRVTEKGALAEEGAARKQRHRTCKPTGDTLNWKGGIKRWVSGRYEGAQRGRDVRLAGEPSSVWGGAALPARGAD